MRFFPIILHFILATTAVGFAVGYHDTPGAIPLIQYPANGLAAGLAFSCFVRVLINYA